MCENTGFYYYPIGALTDGNGYGITFALRTRKIIKSRCCGPSGKTITEKQWSDFLKDNLGDSVYEKDGGHYLEQETL